MMQCTARTTSGEQCKRQAAAGSAYCSLHQRSEEVLVAAPPQGSDAVVGVSALPTPPAPQLQARHYETVVDRDGNEHRVRTGASLAEYGPIGCRYDEGGPDAGEVAGVYVPTERQVNDRPVYKQVAEEAPQPDGAASITDNSTEEE